MKMALLYIFGYQDLATSSIKTIAIWLLGNSTDNYADLTKKHSAKNSDELQIDLL